ncbi:uncharacterized protein LOC126322813 [Schistocerca gregaria]|uniref:uncharacterized protein LOC126322813 n=1 Tax=Schistocerca gregaria TaxID=7010 RepID=UPI00211E0F20|nr:uncharacterized protein LOC126322813 [Schistocerca gregaria]
MRRTEPEGRQPAPSRAWFPGGGCCSCLCIPLRGRRGGGVGGVSQQERQLDCFEPPPAVLFQASPGRAASASSSTPPGHSLYQDSRPKCCKKLLHHNGHPNKVLLFPEEGWARSASSSYWTLTPAWWSRSRCKVVEVAGTRRYSAQAKMVDTGSGSLYIIGTFKRVSPDPDFKLYLTSSVSPSDFNMGYSMTGTLERGCRSSNTFQTTHFAVIRRHDYDMP